MRKRKFVKDIRRSATFFHQMDMLGSVSSYVSLAVSDETKKLAFNPCATYQDIYINALRKVEYNFVLWEYSMFQFSCLENGDLRYCFLPNPFLPSTGTDLVRFSEEMASGIISYEEYSQFLEQEDFCYHVPVIRYECCLDQYRTRCEHPASHLHIGTHTSNRWYVERILTPLMFSMAVAKLYYKGSWDTKGGLWSEGGMYANKFDNEMACEKTKCETLPQEFFARAEKGHLYWA